MMILTKDAQIHKGNGCAVHSGWGGIFLSSKFGSSPVQFDLGQIRSLPNSHPPYHRILPSPTTALSTTKFTQTPV
ncbi:hypothetical protein ACP8HI_25445 [Paenibacillus sp. FA6]|uniref:hypothetical protein n=1 Tax=Paenibacillus sp. FA6 TaxID=3413029 RepID=UPI003F65931F